jgi:hypothetical protein
VAAVRVTVDAVEGTGDELGRLLGGPHQRVGGDVVGDVPLMLVLNSPDFTPSSIIFLNRLM